MRAATRVACAALVLAALACFAAILAPGSARAAIVAHGPQSASDAGPMASINVRELLGDEDEPDEDEADEGAPQSAQQDGSSGVSWPVVIALVAAGALGGFVYMRIRRLVLRLRAWGRGLWARL